MSDILVTRGLYFGSDVLLICDMECDKAWGINNRPRIWVEDENQTIYPNSNYHDIQQNPNAPKINDIDNYVHLADGELGIAPRDAGTYEGSDAKPYKPSIHNKWCARECERCNMIGLRDLPIGESETLRDYSKRHYNMRQEKDSE